MKFLTLITILSSSKYSVFSFTTRNYASFQSISGLPSRLYESTDVISEDAIEKDANEIKRQKRKQALLQLLGSANRAGQPNSATSDPVLAFPDTDEPLQIITESPLMEGGAAGVKVTFRNSVEGNDKIYVGRTDTYYNLLEPIGKDSMDDTNNDNAKEIQTIISDVANQLRVFIPPPLRAIGATATGDQSYIPMRDLFTSPAVSFAYERGWRQGFAAAGFPGADEEFKMVKEYFEPATKGAQNSVVVDMSCATGLFTRRLAKSGEYSRVIGCDYSESMLTEARRRIQGDQKLKNTRVELVRLDVANIPMQSNSVNALHAGAAMHCWPEIDKGLSEIYRVLQPGGRFFASTFLSNYFATVQSTENPQMEANQQAFQYFESTDQLKEMVLAAGFEEDKVSVEVLGSACVIIKCEK